MLRAFARRILLPLVILLITMATLWPEEPAGSIEWARVFCLLCGRAALADALCNLALFLPLGAALTLSGCAPRSAVLNAAALSLSVELAQFVIPGRDPSLGDVVFNTLGAALGVILARAAPRLADPQDHLASRLALASAVGMGIVVALTEILLQPSFPEETYFGGAAEVHTSARPLRIGGNLEPRGFFQGRIDDVRVYNAARNAAEITADMNTPVAAGRASSALVAAYNFDEGTGTRLTDLSGLGNTGQIRGATWTEHGRFGGALLFNGTSDVVIVPSAPSLELTSAMTLEAWIYPTAGQSGWRAVLQKEFDDYFILASSRFGALKPAAGGTFGASTESLAAATAVPIDTWSHVALTYAHSSAKLYINGRLVAHHLRWYPGRVMSATLDGLPIHPGINDASRQLRAGLLSGRPLIVRAEAAEAPSTLAPLVTLHDAERNQILLVAAEADDVVVHLRSRAAAVELDSPALRASGALRGLKPGDPVDMSVSRAQEQYCVIVNGREACGLRFTIGMGWTLLAFSQVPPGWPGTTLNAIWTAGLVWPFGFWFRWRWEAVLGAFVIFLGVVLVGIFGHLGTSRAEFISVVLGALGGWTCSRRHEIVAGIRATLLQ